MQMLQRKILSIVESIKNQVIKYCVCSESWVSLNGRPLTLLLKWGKMSFFMFSNPMALFQMDFIKWKCWYSVRVYLWDLVNSHPLDCWEQRVNASFSVLSKSSRKLLTFESHHMWWQEEISGDCKGTSLLLLIQFSVPKADILKILSSIWCQTINLCVWGSAPYCHFLNWRKGKKIKVLNPLASRFLRRQGTGFWGPCQICIK